VRFNSLSGAYVKKPSACIATQSRCGLPLSMRCARGDWSAPQQLSRRGVLDGGIITNMPVSARAGWHRQRAPYRKSRITDGGLLTVSPEHCLYQGDELVCRKLRIHSNSPRTDRARWQRRSIRFCLVCGPDTMPGVSRVPSRVSHWRPAWLRSRRPGLGGGAPNERISSLVTLAAELAALAPEQPPWTQRWNISWSTGEPCWLHARDSGRSGVLLFQYQRWAWADFHPYDGLVDCPCTIL